MNEQQPNLNRLAAHVLAHEEWLMERILHYALIHDYTKYTSTLVEPWRLSIAGLSRALTDAIKAGRQDLELSPDEDLTLDVIAAFAVLEAQRHRQRGINLAMFLGLMKYYRQAYLDLLDQTPSDLRELPFCRTYLHRFFDRLEIAFCVEWSGRAENITIKELQEENRRMTNEKNLYLTALESHPDAMLLVDENGYILEMNSSASALLGLDQPPGTTYYRSTIRQRDSKGEDGTDGKRLTTLLPCLIGPYRTVRNTEERLEITLLAAENGRYYRTLLSPILDVSRKFQGVLVAMTDISPSVKAYQQLQKEQAARSQAEQRLSSVLQATNQLGMAETAFDNNNTIVAFSPGLAKMSGFSAEEVIGKSPFLFLADPRDTERLRQLLTLALQRQGPISSEMHFKKKNDGVLQALITINPIWDQSHQQISGFLTVVIDISERKHLEQQILQSEKMASIAGLATGVAHEINTPLSAILQSIQIIEEGLDPEATSNQLAARTCGLDFAALDCYLRKQDLPFFLGGIRSAAENASRIVVDLLQFSRPSDNKQVQVDIHTLLDTSLALVKSDYQLKKLYNLLDLEVEKSYATDLPSLFCIPHEIEQVLINLFKNAIQSMATTPAARRRLSVCTSIQAGMLSIAIADRGQGMDPATQRRIFDPFFTTKEVGQGTGLGLTVSHTIICGHHNGQILVESEPGFGSCFTILFPLQD